MIGDDRDVCTAGPGQRSGTAWRGGYGELAARDAIRGAQRARRGHACSVASRRAERPPAFAGGLLRALACRLCQAPACRLGAPLAISVSLGRAGGVAPDRCATSLTGCVAGAGHVILLTNARSVCHGVRLGPLDLCQERAALRPVVHLVNAGRRRVGEARGDAQGRGKEAESGTGGLGAVLDRVNFSRVGAQQFDGLP